MEHMKFLEVSKEKFNEFVTNKSLKEVPGSSSNYHDFGTDYADENNVVLAKHEIVAVFSFYYITDVSGEK